MDKSAPVLGDILAEALKKTQRVITVTRMVPESKDYRIPEWMFYAMEGRKMAAIKALREEAGEDSMGKRMSLLHAKQLVDNFCL